MPMNYNSLLIELQRYANRFDQPFIDQLPNLVEKGINRIYSEARNIGFEKTVNGNFVVGTANYAKPVDWRQTISFGYTNNNNVTFLLNRSLEFCVSYWPNFANTSLPLFYADNLAYTNFTVVPTPNAANQFVLIYLSLPLFNAENPTNFLTQRYPQLLLYSCLVDVMSYLKDDQRLPIFESLYKAALANINRDTKERKGDRTSDGGKD